MTQRSRTVVQEAMFGGSICHESLQESTECGTGCCIPTCDGHAVLKTSSQNPCGECVCFPGWAGPGIICGEDQDADAFVYKRQQ